MDLYPIINEVLLSLKQWVPGRMVRRDGVIDGNIWVLNGRIPPTLTWPGIVSLSAGARRLLRDYPQRKEVSMLEPWTVYDSPIDLPGRFVARKRLLDQPTNELLQDKTLDGLRGKLPPTALRLAVLLQSARRKHLFA